MTALQQTYTINLRPFSIEDLALDHTIVPPSPKAKLGRPSKKRKQAGQGSKRGKSAATTHKPAPKPSGPGTIKCSECKEKGHNKLTCPAKSKPLTGANWFASVGMPRTLPAEPAITTGPVNATAPTVTNCTDNSQQPSYSAAEISKAGYSSFHHEASPTDISLFSSPPTGYLLEFASPREDAHATFSNQLEHNHKGSAEYYGPSAGTGAYGQEQYLGWYDGGYYVDQSERDNAYGSW